MRSFQLAIFCLICVFKSYGQTVDKSYGAIDVEITKEKHPKKISAIVKIKRAFPAGDSSWVQRFEKDLNESIRIGKGAKKGKHIVSVQFIVLKDSSLSDIRCLNDPGYGMGEQVIRRLKKNIKWIPGNYLVRPYRR